MLAVRQQTTLRPWLFLSPALALILLFIVLPFVLTVAFSFTDQRLVPNPNVPTEWIGWRNYARVFENEDFVRTLLNTAYFTVLVVPLQCGLGLAVACDVADEHEGTHRRGRIGRQPQHPVERRILPQ